MKIIWMCLVSSVGLNILFVINIKQYGRDSKRQNIGRESELSWSRKAAEEAEAVGAINCSGHGRAQLDGGGLCECNQCYQGPHCSFFNYTSQCLADADSGDPLFLEPFWMRNAESSAVLIPGWHRMSYLFPDKSFMSSELETHVRRFHSIAKNAITQDKYIVFGTGSTQLVSAAVFALSRNNNLSSPSAVVAKVPYYPLYQVQTDYFETARFEFQGDALLVKNTSRDGTRVIEFVTSPNNPDARLRKAVLKGHNVRAVYDHAYYWPHYTAIQTPADEDLMIFTASKLTGHAGSRFGWALVRDQEVYTSMLQYIAVAEMGTSKETQLRVLQLLKSALQGDGRQIFQFGYETMRDRWERLNKIMSLSKRFTLQEIPTQFCTFFEQVREPSPAYAWVKCEREEDIDCKEALLAANIIGREGSFFGTESRYVRLSLLKSQDDFNLLLRRLTELVSQENGKQIM